MKHTSSKIRIYRVRASRASRSKTTTTMDAVRETLAKFGTAWNNDVPAGLMKLYEPLQAKQNATYGNDIKAEKGLKYGSDPRHRIDVYTPANADAASGTSGKPVVVFVHGGGYTLGDNDATPNVYSNVGKSSHLILRMNEL